MSPWLLVLALVIPSAPVSAQPNTGTVAGKVTFRGQPLVEGTVTFIASRANVAARIGQDGNYRASGVPVGKVLSWSSPKS